MNNKIAALVAAMVILRTVTFAEAQRQVKVHKIGWLGARPAASATGLKTLARELKALGYIEGKNITFESRYAEDKFSRLPTLADELVRLKVDVILAPGSSEALAARNATRKIPIVFLFSTDPIAAGLVESLARPGGNITGFTSIASVLSGKRLELLKETIRNLSRVAVLWHPKSPGSDREWKESQLAAREPRLQLHSIEVNSADQFDRAFKEATKVGSMALTVTSSPFFNSNVERIADLATKNQLPAIYTRGDFVARGGLMSYGPNRFAEPYRRVASMVDKILKGTKPADIPVEQPTKFEFIINLKAAKQIGLTIPPNVLARADKVIK